MCQGFRTFSTFLFYFGAIGGVESVRKGNRRLNYEDRKRIEKMKEQGARAIVIADTIGVHRATIYNELKRGGTPYRAEVAQRTV